MVQCIGRALILLAMFSIVGGHWAVLQAVAWVGMVADYSQTSSVGVALGKTFSGEDPCSMCRAIEKGKAAETKLPALAQGGKKWDGFLLWQTASPPPPPESPFSYPPVADVLASALSSAPPSPVPKAA